MPDTRLWIRGGTVITGQGERSADLLVEGERIAAIEDRPEGAAEKRRPPATGAAGATGATGATGAAGPAGPAEADALDARGLWILPGGVDAHVHMGMPLRPGVRSLGWRESTTAALLGGTTTVVDFANPERGESLADAVDRTLAQAERESLCDFALHVTVPEATEQRLAEIPALVARGFPTFKAFLAYKGRLMLTPPELERVMLAVKDAGGRLLVHAEDGEAVAQAEAQLEHTGRIGPEWFPSAHPASAEIRAVETTIALAARTGCPVTLVHLTLAASLEAVLRERRATALAPDALTAEVCLHHLFQSAVLYRSGYDAALRAILSPPLRTPADADALLGALAAGDIDLLSTDHCEFPLAIKRQEAMHGFTSIPNGAGGVGERLIVSYSLGVCRGRLSPETWVRACCERPAALMGLGGRKGRVEVGADADLILFDPAAKGTRLPIGPGDPTSRLWTGATWQGAVRHVLRRGASAVRAGARSSGLVRGAFLARPAGRAA